MLAFLFDASRRGTDSGGLFAVLGLVLLGLVFGAELCMFVGSRTSNVSAISATGELVSKMSLADIVMS